MKVFNKEIKIWVLYIWLFITYFFFSPTYFSFVYPGNIYGENTLVYIIPLFVCFITMLIALPILLVIKNRVSKKIVLGYTFLFFIIFSSLLGGLLLMDLDDTLTLQTFLISNMIGLLISFICVFFFSKEQ